MLKSVHVCGSNFSDFVRGCLISVFHHRLQSRSSRIGFRGPVERFQPKIPWLLSSAYISATATITLNLNQVAEVTKASTSVDVSTGDLARDGITALDAAIKQVNVQRSELGAVSNRLNHTVNNLTNISSNLSAAKGGIEDADFAVETTNLAKNQILQQASTAMLAQANASKQNVLSLLQG